MPRYWLLKTEPESFSIDDLERVGREEWSGVRNYVARNLMREMRTGDLAFFYHSSTKPIGIAGICEVVAAAHPDSTQFDKKSEYYDPSSTLEDPKWWCVDVGFVRRLPRFVTLEELRAVPALAFMPLLRKGQRLSVQTVSPQEWKRILKLAEVRPPDSA
ncbi:MAG: EVE domain-containing protein [Candidatus Eremiobacteraeota bacterium]|nr:EVE domain-containing protein [Candidatus Eremiobacteraeota bacterium]